MTKRLRTCALGLSCAIAMAASMALPSPVVAQVVINEVFENPPGTDAEWEYIELYGRPGMDLTGYAIALLKGGQDFNRNGVIDPGDVVPEIDEAYTLDGLSLGSNGFLVIYNDTLGFSNLIDLNLIPAGTTVVSFTAAHIPTSPDTAGGLDDSGSSTYALVRKRPHHSIDEFGASVYGPEYAFHKDVRHDVNFDDIVDFGTEVNTINTGEPARNVEHFQMVDDFAWSNQAGKEYVRDPQWELSDTPGVNPDAVSRFRYYIRNPYRGYRTTGNALAPFDIKPTSIADESFIYGEITNVFPGPTFLQYSTALDALTGYPLTKGPTDPAATRFTGSCDPEPDDFANPGCLPNASGAYEFTDISIVGFKLTPGSFNDHPNDANRMQFRFIRGDFNCDGAVNQIDRRLIEDRVGNTLDDTESAVYDPTPTSPASGDEVSYDRYLRQGVEFQLTLMMRDMDLTDGAGGTNADAITQSDVDAFLLECTVCGSVETPPAVRITEYMYSGAGGEFVEFTNLSGSPVDMTGWSYSDSAGLPGHVDLSAFGIVQPGESVILAESDRAQFAIDWNIVGARIIGRMDVNLGRNDEINLYDAAGNLADRLTFGDQDFAGTIRTQNFSGWPCDVAVGANAIASWRLSLIGGDAQNSRFSAKGDVGSPGSFVVSDCSSTIPNGACCTAGICSSLPGVTQAYCQATGGVYQGDGVNCSTVTCPQPSNAVVRITEYMYSGPGGEFIEVTNLHSGPVDFTGWSFDDSARLQGTFDLSAIGTLAVGESAIITEATAAAFRAHWGLAPTVKVVGDLGLGGVGNNLGREDEINIFDASGTLVDRLTYGDQTFPGTIRAQNATGWPCSFAVGQNDIANWILSTVADAQNSIDAGGAIGSPGVFVPDACAGSDPVGACCRIAGDCDDGLTQEACTATNGVWQGADTVCVTADCPSPSDQQMRITEWMYNPLTGSGEFVEFTNIGNTPIDMTGWSYDDDSRTPGSVSLSGFGTVAPGQSVILTEVASATFIANWGLSGVTVIGPHSNNLGRNDEVNLYDANGLLVDRLTYGDQNFPGTIRTAGISGWTCLQNLGANNVYGWQLSVVGDQQGSYNAGTGDRGNPGVFVGVPCSLCSTCLGDADQNGSIALADIAAFVDCALGNSLIDDCRCADMNEDGEIDGRDIQAFAGAVVGGPGSCP